MLTSCAEEGADTVAPELELATESQILSLPSAQSISLDFSSNGEVEVRSNRSWCAPKQSVVAKDGELTLSVEENTGRFERTATVTLVNGSEERQFELTQPKGEYRKGMHYQIPVVFHLIYKDASNKQHNPDAEVIYEVFDKLVDLYANCGENLNISFVLAEEDEQGETLAERGIHRIEKSWSTMACMTVMGDTSGKYKELGWDPRRYLNVTIYEFGDSFSILGLSRAPYLVKPHSLSGISDLNYYRQPSDLSFLYSISLNNSYLYPADITKYNLYDFGVTLAHEIGHYLGLFHPFSETTASDGTQNTCDDTDFCDDTPSYNKYQYDNFVYQISATCAGDFNAEQIEMLSMRTSCEGGIDKEFRSTNIMDYAVGDANTFSAEQVQRMRYILENSPYIPGIKSVDFEQEDSKASRGETSEPMPLNLPRPIVIKE